AGSCGAGDGATVNVPSKLGGAWFCVGTNASEARSGSAIMKPPSTVCSMSNRTKPCSPVFLGSGVDEKRRNLRVFQRRNSGAREHRRAAAHRMGDDAGTSSD